MAQFASLPSGHDAPRGFAWASKEKKDEEQGAPYSGLIGVDRGCVLLVPDRVTLGGLRRRHGPEYPRGETAAGPSMSSARAMPISVHRRVASSRCSASTISPHRYGPGRPPRPPGTGRRASDGRKLRSHVLFCRRVPPADEARFSRAERPRACARGRNRPSAARNGGAFQPGQAVRRCRRRGFRWRKRENAPVGDV